MTLIFSLPRRASNARGNFASRSWIQEPHPPAAVVEIHQQVARLLQHPGSVRPGRAGEVLDPPTAEREEDEHVQATQPDRVDCEEVTGKDRLTMSSKEASPRLPITLWRWRQPSVGKDVADRGG
jgi:hypothetical protein